METTVSHKKILGLDFQHPLYVENGFPCERRHDMSLIGLTALRV